MGGLHGGTGTGIVASSNCLFLVLDRGEPGSRTWATLCHMRVPPMKRDLILRGGRVLQSGASQAESLDVLIGAEGRILAIAPQVSREGAEVLALDGRLVVPGLVDMHQHLDKSRTRKLLSNPEGTLDGAIAAYRAIAAGITREEMIARARGTVAACSARGTVAIRSHTNIDPPTRLRGIEAMLALRES